MRMQKISVIGKKYFYSILMVFLCSFILSVSLAIISIKFTKNNEKENAYQIATIQAGKLKNVIENKLSTAETIASIIKTDNDASLDMNTLMNEIVDIHNLSSISLAPNGIINATYPLEGNESTINHDLLNDPDRAVEATIALDSHKLTLSGPYELRQGFYGAVGRLAVFLNDEKGEEYFWGFVCITLKFPDTFDEVQIENLSKHDYTYRIWRISPDTEKKQSILEKGTVGSDAITTTISLPNAKWYLSIDSKSGWIDTWDSVLRCGIAILFSFLITLLYVYLRSLEHSRNNLRISMEQQSENYLQMNQLNNELRAFRHDMSNHMLSLSNLLANKDIQQAQQYIEHLSTSFLTSVPIANTENYVFDALLAEKKSLANKAGITIECEIYLNRKLNIDNMDWSILFGNLLDNALEAATSYTTNTPIIRLQMLCRGNMLHVKLINSCQVEPIIKNGKFISNKINAQYHGQGMKHIEAIVKKYNGSMETTYENHQFTISFILSEV